MQNDQHEFSSFSDIFHAVITSFSLVNSVNVNAQVTITTGRLNSNSSDTALNYLELPENPTNTDASRLLLKVAKFKFTGYCAKLYMISRLFFTLTQPTLKS